MESPPMTNGTYHHHQLDESKANMELEMEEDDDEVVQWQPLCFQDETLHSDTLTALNMMRKNRHFCDVILHVGNAEIHAHRAILASVSPYFFELFSTEVEQKKHVENVITYKLNGGFDKKALKLLIEYAYTATLEIPVELVKAVYLAAGHLKIDRVARRCAQHLIKHLSVDNCIEIRSLSGIARNKEFVQQVDAFIATEFEQISQSSSMFNLFCTKIEILNQSRQEMDLVNHVSLCRLVLDWIRRQVNEETLSMSTLNERTHMLYLGIDNSLQDCASLPPGDVCDTDIVQDYKKMSLKNVQSTSKPKRKSIQPSKPRVLIYSREIGEELVAEMEPDWNLIASAKVGEHTFLALVTLAGQLMILSIQLRLNAPSTPSPLFTTPVISHPASEDKPDLYCALANMSNPRCAVGCGNLHNTLVVCGGYDRIECLRTAEQYDPETNTWRTLPQMKESRGRFQVAVLDGKIYAIGGSNGTTELDTVEMLDVPVGKWVAMPKLPLARSNPGVCDLDGLIYCVGGWNGQVGIKQCDVFDPAALSWTSIAPLNIGRYQTGVAAYVGLLFAIGGCDSWNCLGSVEVYNPDEDVWTLARPIITARRGCGVAVFNEMLYVVGGSDGTHSLNSTEIYDACTETWIVGPSMTTPRANVEVVVVGKRLYAVGGFSGKNFLNTIEYLDINTNEWTTFVPKYADVINGRRSRTPSRHSTSEAVPEITALELNGTTDAATIKTVKYCELHDIETLDSL